ncbi:MAG: hypothetical protein AAFY22_14090, partial [Pseudomonadota bacterium]
MTIVSGTKNIGANDAWRDDGALTVYDAPDGADAMAVAAAAAARGGVIVYVARDGARAADIAADLMAKLPDGAAQIFGMTNEDAVAAADECVMLAVPWS